MRTRTKSLVVAACLIMSAGCVAEPNDREQTPVQNDAAEQETDTGGQSTPDTGSDAGTTPDAEDPADASDSSDDSDESDAPVPAITTIELVKASGGDFVVLETIDDGAEINRADLDGLVNIQAVSESPEETGSVRFVLEGPTSFERIENDEPYTMAASPAHLDPSAGEPAVGDYTLTVTPYAKADGGGEAGDAKVVSFSVINEGGNPPQNNDGGFTTIEPSADSRLVYVSSSQGDDSNDCLSETSPCKTIAAGRGELRDGYPDHLYLKRGDVWRGERLVGFGSGRSNAEPMVVAFYGDSGPRPKLEVSSSQSIGSNSPRYLHFIGLHLDAYKLDPDHPEFNGEDSANIVMIDNHQDLLFEDMVFDHIEVVSHPFNGSKPKNLTFRRNIWTGKYVTSSSYHRNSRPSNIYAKVEGLKLIENVFDYGGWHPSVEGAGANMFNHNIYLQGVMNGEDIVVRGNIVTRGSSHGIQMRAGGLAEDNFFGRNAVGLSIGYSQGGMVDGVRAHLVNNVISEGHSMVKGHDACTGTNLCTPAMWGIDVDLRGGNADWKVEGNVVANLSPDDNQTRYSSLVEVAIKNFGDPSVQWSNNLAWKWESATQGTDQTYSDPGRTLADYNAHLGGAPSFDAFMQVVRNRSLQTWDERYSAYAINDYIRAGFDR